MRIDELLQEITVELAPSSSVHAALKLFEQYQLDFVPVISSGNYITILAHADLVRFISEYDRSHGDTPLHTLLEQRTVAQVGVKEPPVVTTEVEFQDAVNILLNAPCGVAAVLDPDNGALLGIIRLKDALGAMREMFSDT